MSSRVRAVWLGLVLLGCSSAPSPSPAASPRRAPAAPAEGAGQAAPPPEPGPAPRPEPAEPTSPTEPVPPAVRIPLDQEARVDELVALALRRNRMPGAVVVMGRGDGVVFQRAYGLRAVEPEEEVMTTDTLFDLASLTKPVVTATLVAMLVESGAIDLDAPASTYLPELTAGEEEGITVRQLLTHTAGLPAANPLSDYDDGPEEAMERILAIEPVRRPGAYEYSDVGFIVLGELVERVAGAPLDDLARERIFEPLGMTDSTFHPDAELWPRIAPTERSDKRDPQLIRGEVHDPRAWRLGGVAGNAGLFSTAADLSRFARMLLGDGEVEGTRLLAPETMRRFTEPVRVGRTWRTLGWNAERDGTFGHGGFTGTALWVDPDDDLFVLLLSNRVHPDGGGDVRSLVRHLRMLAANAVPRAAPAPEEGVRVLSGIDVLRRDRFRALEGERVGLVTNVSGRARDGRATIDLLAGAPGVRLVALFAPEHGLRGTEEGRVAQGVDRRTGLPVFSLFGARRSPSAESLRDIDTLVFDIQDVGARFYTYGSTLLATMRAAAENDVKVLVLDRPNPVGGVRLEGPVLDADDEDLRSFVNYHPLPVRHGTTMGELARMLNAELDLGAQLEVVPVEGWSRAMLWPETGLRWVPPSPNLRDPEQVLLYPGIALLEGTNVSVGRGTASPFQLVGAPWMDGERLAADLRDAGVEGISVEPTRFVPRAGPHRGRRCRGIRLTVTDPETLSPVRLGLEIAHSLAQHHPDSWDADRLALMIGDRALTERLLEGEPVEELIAETRSEVAAFFAVRQRYLLYD